MQFSTWMEYILINCTINCMKQNVSRIAVISPSVSISVNFPISVNQTFFVSKKSRSMSIRELGVQFKYSGGLFVLFFGFLTSYAPKSDFERILGGIAGDRLRLSSCNNAVSSMVTIKIN